MTCSLCSAASPSHVRPQPASRPRSWAPLREGRCSQGSPPCGGGRGHRAKAVMGALSDALGGARAPAVPVARALPRRVGVRPCACPSQRWHGRVHRGDFSHFRPSLMCQPVRLCGESLFVLSLTPTDTGVCAHSAHHGERAPLFLGGSRVPLRLAPVSSGQGPGSL